ncbi:alpha/beta hydrolase, partial [Streptomyces sp. SID7760]|nr:alpha/beta hydrolase [Streptomyces sp. SID7760]
MRIRRRTAAAVALSALLLASRSPGPPPPPSRPPPHRASALELSRPTSPFVIGSKDLHLVDRGRTGPWAH